VYGGRRRRPCPRASFSFRPGFGRSRCARLPEARPAAIVGLGSTQGFGESSDSRLHCSVDAGQPRAIRRAHINEVLTVDHRAEPPALVPLPAVPTGVPVDADVWEALLRATAPSSADPDRGAAWRHAELGRQVYWHPESSRPCDLRWIRGHRPAAADEALTDVALRGPAAAPLSPAVLAAVDGCMVLTASTWSTPARGAVRLDSPAFREGNRGAQVRHRPWPPDAFADRGRRA